MHTDGGRDLSGTSPRLRKGRVVAGIHSLVLTGTRVHPSLLETPQPDGTRHAISPPLLPPILGTNARIGRALT